MAIYSQVTRYREASRLHRSPPLAQNPHKFKEKFSLEFERSFLTDLGRRHHTNQVKANSFYSEYITDKEHLYMNATRWTSLTEFVKCVRWWLADASRLSPCPFRDCGRRALLKVEEKDDGFYITWIDRSMGGVETEEQRQERREKTVADDAGAHGCVGQMFGKITL